MGKWHPHAGRARAASINGTRRDLLRTALGLAVAGPLNASGKGHKLSVEIDAGNAAVTLGEFIRQTGLQVLFETDAIRSHTTRAVRGQFDAAEALHLMLEGSGLIFEFINERTIAVRPELSRPAGQGGVLPSAVDLRRL
jgi:iron complex outermembrane receptor protein